MRRGCRLLLSSVCYGVFAWDRAIGDSGIAPFTEEAIERGLIYEIMATGPGSPQGYGWGVAIADLNGNGHQDIALMGHATGMVGFFENDGTGHFTDRSDVLNEEGVPLPKFVVTKPSGMCVADYNGNGLLDIYITQFMDVLTGATFPGLLLRNDGNFNFTERAEEAGVSNFGNGQPCAWGDFDNDGWADLYVANYGFPEYWDDPVHRNKLYRNLGDETFENLSVQQGVDDSGQGFGVAFSDINRNGWLDLYVANDRGFQPDYSPNQLWQNNAGQFQNICATSGACLGLAGMCVGVGDFKGDGVIDVVDLVGLLDAWGPVQPGTEIMDITGNGVIGVDDLLALLEKWPN